MTVFGQPPFQFFNTQQGTHEPPFYLLNALIFLGECFFEFDILLSQLARLFFGYTRRVSTLSSSSHTILFYIEQSRRSNLLLFHDILFSVSHETITTKMISCSSIPK